MLLSYFFLFILGAVVGSFLGMLSWRLPRGLAITGRSTCDNCGKYISWRDNIPIFGWFFLRGKCRVCKKLFSLRYPIIEFLCALSFVLVGFIAQDLWELVFLLVFTSLSFALLVVDLEHKILPDKLTLLLGVVVFLFVFALPSPLMFSRVIVGFFVFLFFLTIYLATSGRGMGFGDVKLSFVLGSALGYPYILVWLFISFFTGALVGILLMILGRAGFKSEIAFGPYLLVGVWITLFWGDVILEYAHYI